MKRQEEVWKEIDGFSGFYLVSNLGRVKSIAHFKRIRGGALQPIKERILAKSCRFNKVRNCYHYVMVSLNFNGKRKLATVHRLVANAFLPNPSNYPCVNHKDGNKYNNDVDNLEWCSYSYNNRHAFAMGLKHITTTRQIICIQTGEIFSSVKEACDKNGYKYNLLQQHLHKVRYKKSFHGFNYEYVK